MTRRIACLHTAESNIGIFEAAAAGLDVTFEHVVRADLLAAAERAGGLTPEIVGATQRVLQEVAGTNDAVLLACSTLGPVADEFAASVPVKRIDRALAEAAVASGGRVAVLYTFPGTRAATEALFQDVASGTGAVIEMILVTGAWEVFKAGEAQRYREMIAEAADHAAAVGAASVAFAQASMAPAAALCRVAQPLSSPRISLLAVASAHP